MRLNGVVPKGWGSENIFVSNDHYCGKFLNFNEGAKFSMHFHAKKMETWYIMEGKIKLHILDTKNAQVFTRILTVGDVWTNDPLVPHQIEAIEKSVILEVSTPDSVEDNYRVMPGDSQCTT